MGRKPDDWPWGVEVCDSCHRYFHAEGRRDHELMCKAMGEQQLVYRERGIIVLRNPEGSTWNV